MPTGQPYLTIPYISQGIQITILDWMRIITRDNTDTQAENFLIYKEIQNGAKSYVRKGFLLYAEMRKYLTYIRRPLVICDFAF
jgi:hypothetical protein